MPIPKNNRRRDEGRAIAAWGTFQPWLNANPNATQGERIAAWGQHWANVPTAAQPAPAAPPAPPAPPVWSPDSGYSDSVAMAKRRYEAAIGGLDAEERNTNFEYNDPTNPFNRINEAKRIFLQRGKSITGGLASRGQLYSGVHQARLDVNRRDEEKDAASAKAEYEKRIADIKSRRGAASTAREEEELRARLESMSRQGVS